MQFAEGSIRVTDGTGIHQHTLRALYAREYVVCVGTGDDRRIQITDAGHTALANAAAAR